MPAFVERSVERLPLGAALAHARDDAAAVTPGCTPAASHASDPIVNADDPQTLADRDIRHASERAEAGNRELHHDPSYPQGVFDRQAGSVEEPGPSPLPTAPAPDPTKTVEHAYTVAFGLRLASPNAHELPLVRHHRVKLERDATAWALVAHRVPRQMPDQVHLTRHASGHMDSDNLIAAFKAIRDEIAKHCGFDDRNPHVKWVYGQGYAKQPEVEIVCVWRTPR